MLRIVDIKQSELPTISLEETSSKLSNCGPSVTGADISIELGNISVSGSANLIAPSDGILLPSAVASPGASKESMANAAMYRTAPQLSGNLQIDPEIHLPSPGMDVDIAYYYNSNSEYNGPYGYGRTINTNLLAQALGTPAVVSLTRGNGLMVSYAYDSGSSQYVPQTVNLLNTLVEDTTHNLWKEITPDGVMTAYPRDLTGQVTSVVYAQDAIGNRHTFSYASGMLESLEDAVGRRVTFSYNGDDVLESIQDWAGRRTTFQYDTTSVVGKPALTTVIGPSGCQTGYGYEVYSDTPRLNQITDPNGYATTYAYDNNNRVTERTVAGIGTTFYGYRTRQVIVHDAEDRHSITTVDENYNQQSITNNYGTQWRATRNAQGQVTASQDALGIKWTVSYSNNMPVVTTDPLGRSTTIQYDAYKNPTTLTYANGATVSLIWGYSGSPFDTTGERRRLQARVDSLGNRTSFSYNARGQMGGVQNALGHRTTYNYDAFGNNIETVDALGAVTTRVFDAAGNVASVIDPLGRRVTAVYDAQDRITESIDALGYITSFGYDSIGNMMVHVDALGNRTSLVYNVFDRPVQSMDALGQITTVNYDRVGSPISSIDALGQQTTFSYDLAGRLIGITEPLGMPYRRNVLYDAAGRVEGIVDELGRITTFVYDALGQRIATIFPLGNRTSITYNSVARPMAFTDALGHIKTNIYDTESRLLARQDAIGSYTSFSYDALGQRIGVLDARGFRTTWQYDAVGRVRSISSPLGFTTTYQYNPAGEPIATIDALGQITSSSFDARGNLETATNPLGYSATIAYDALSRPIATTDANGRVTSAVYDALGQLIAQQSALGYRVSFAYDGIGQQRSVTDANGHITSNLYDANGRLTARQDPLGRRMTFTYDKVGNLATKVDARGEVATYLYDELDRTTQITYTNGQRSEFWYDAMSQVLRVSDSTGLFQYSYDANHRLILSRDGLDRVLSYSYDALGNRRAMQDPDGGRTEYSYDAQDRLTNIRNPFGEVTTFTYDALSRESRKLLPNNTSISHSYDPAGREIILEQRDGTGGLQALFTTTYDGVGNRLSISESAAEPGNLTTGALTTYLYDKDYQLLAEARSGSSSYVLSFSYDGAGNRLVQNQNGVLTTYLYDAANQLLQAATDTQSTSYAYDAVGNRTSRRVGTEVTTYRWNTVNRLEETTQPDGWRERYQYGADGLRRSKMNPAGTTQYIWDGPNILQEVDVLNQTQVQYSGYPGAWGGLVSQRRALPTTDGPLLLARWEDNSGNGHDATQADPARQPLWVANALNGKPAVRFSGGQEFNLAGIPQAAPSEIFLVYKAGDANSASLFNQIGFDTSLFNGGSGDGAELLLGANDGAAPQILAGATDATDRPSVQWDETYSYDTALSGWHIVRFRLGVSEIGIAVDSGTEQTFSHGVSTLAEWNRLCQGTFNQFSGDIAEVLIYNAALSSDERSRIERYLTQKYDLGVILPGSYGDLHIWFRADAGITKSSNNRVSQWADQSDSGFLAAQSVPTKQPLWVADAGNGHPAIRFDGGDSFAVNTYGPGGTGITVFVVALGEDYQNIVCYGNSDYVIYPWKSEQGEYRWIQASDGGTNGVAAGLVQGQWNLGTAKWDAGQTNGMAAWRNGQLIAQRDAYNTTMPTEPLWIGSWRTEINFFKGDVAEILVYDVALSDEDRESVQEYLAQKYSLPGAFDPTGIEGLELWLRADAGVGDSSFYGFDTRGNTRLLTDSEAVVTDSYVYNGYGEQLAAIGETSNPFRFGGTFGYYFDDSSQTDVRVRVYDSETGRWLSQDPIGFSGGDWNLYRYVSNNPGNYVDPSGLQFSSVAEGFGFMGAASGAGAGFLIGGPIGAIIGAIAGAIIAGGLAGMIGCYHAGGAPSRGLLPGTGEGLRGGEDVIVAEMAGFVVAGLGARALGALNRPLRRVSFGDVPKRLPATPEQIEELAARTKKAWSEPKIIARARAVGLPQSKIDAMPGIIDDYHASGNVGFMKGGGWADDSNFLVSPGRSLVGGGIKSRILHEGTHLLDIHGKAMPSSYDWFDIYRAERMAFGVQMGTHPLNPGTYFGKYLAGLQATHNVYGNSGAAVYLAGTVGPLYLGAQYASDHWP